MVRANVRLGFVILYPADSVWPLRLKKIQNVRHTQLYTNKSHVR